MRARFVLHGIVNECTIGTVTEHGAEAIRQMASALELASSGADRSARECALDAREAIGRFLDDLERRLVLTIPAPDTIPAAEVTWTDSSAEQSAG